jgi:hypothetical protein
MKLKVILEKLTPKRVFFISLLGFLPILGLLLVSRSKAGEMLRNPQKNFQIVEELKAKGKILIALGNIGDAIGYYFIVLPFAYLFAQKKDAPLVRGGAWLIFAYGVNGAFWALISAIALPLAVSSGYKAWERVTLICQRLGWGILGNTLGSSGWILLGVGLREKWPGFSVFSISLGVMYFFGGTIARLFVPNTFGLIATMYYFFLQLLVWNPWVAQITRQMKDEQ